MANRFQTSLLGTLDQMQERISKQDNLLVPQSEKPRYALSNLDQLIINRTSTDPTLAILWWEQPWQSTFLPDFPIPTNLFADVDPIIDVEGFGQSWSNMPDASSDVPASALVTTKPLATPNASATSLRPDDKEVLRFEEHHSVFGDDRVMRGIKVRFNKTKKTTSYFLDKGRNHRRADIIGHNGHSVGGCWPYQICLLRDGIHGSLQGGIYGNKASGAYSIVVLGDSAYATMDQDVGDTLYYSGSGSLENTDPDNPKETEGTAALQTSALNKNPVRVIRGKNKMKKDAPKAGFRYDGLYNVVAQEQLINGKGGAYLRFKLERLPVQPLIDKSRPNANDLKKFRAIKQAVQEKLRHT